MIKGKVEEQTHYEIEIDWNGPNLYEIVYRNGKKIGMAWVGGENEEYEGDMRRRKISEAEVKEIMGDFFNPTAEQCVRYDLS